jgi:hypothetical protein
MSSPTPAPSSPVLPYADDAQAAARVRSITLLSRWLLVAMIAGLVLWAAGWATPAKLVWVYLAAYYATLLSLMTLTAILGIRLNNVVTGIVLALLIMIPCAGLFVPIIVLMHSRDYLRRVAAEGTAVKP